MLNALYFKPHALSLGSYWYAIHHYFVCHASYCRCPVIHLNISPIVV